MDSLFTQEALTSHNDRFVLPYAHKIQKKTFLSTARRVTRPIYIFKVGQFAHNATLDRDGGLVERSSCAAADRGPSRARVLGRAAVAAGLAAIERGAR